MKKILLLSLLTILINLCLNNCVTAQFLLPPSIDSDLQPYLTSFLKEGDNYGMSFDTSNLVMKITSVPQDKDNKKDETTVGLCFSDYFGKKYIVIDTKFWKKESYFRREAVIFHELGHCLLNRDHLDTVIKAHVSYKSGNVISAITEEVPVSIMNSFSPHGMYYVIYHKYYMYELFNNISKEEMAKHKRPKSIPCVMLKTCK